MSGRTFASRSLADEYTTTSRSRPWLMTASYLPSVGDLSRQADMGCMLMSMRGASRGGRETAVAGGVCALHLAARADRERNHAPRLCLGVLVPHAEWIPVGPCVLHMKA